MPLIVYVDYKDVTGAEYLAKFYVAKERFFEVVVDKRRLLKADGVKKLSKTNSQVKEAIKTGYAIQLFDQD